MKPADIQKLHGAGLITDEPRHKIVARFRLKEDSRATTMADERTAANAVLVRTGIKRLGYGCLLLLLVLTLSGCKTTNGNSSPASHPEAYRRVAILPICICGSSPTDYPVATGDTEASRRQTAEQLAFSLTNGLARKGYQVVGPVSVLCDDQDWWTLDPVAGGILRQQFGLEMIRTDRGETNALYTCDFVSNLPVLQEKLNLPEVDAVVLLERSPGYVSPQETRKARWWIWPAGAAVASVLVVGGLANGDASYSLKMLDGAAMNEPLLQVPDSIDYSIYIFDFHTQKIIFNRCQTFKYRVPGGAVRALLKPLPKAGKTAGT